MSAKERQQGALDRLEAQLASGKKTQKKSFDKVALTDSNKKRIQKEINTLKKILG